MISVLYIYIIFRTLTTGDISKDPPNNGHRGNSALAWSSSYRIRNLQLRACLSLHRPTKRKGTIMILARSACSHPKCPRVTRFQNTSLEQLTTSPSHPEILIICATRCLFLFLLFLMAGSRLPSPNNILGRQVREKRNNKLKTQNQKLVQWVG